MTTDPYPGTSEFTNTRADAPYGCADTPAGRVAASPISCVVCATWSIVKRYAGVDLNLAALGKSMGARHRAWAEANGETNHHGLAVVGSSPQVCSPGGAWCAFCSYLELKARGIGVGYGRLTLAQLRAQADARHPVVVLGWYATIPAVSPTSYSTVVPARGRSDGGAFYHGVLAWERRSDGAYVVSDADFGSVARSVVPPHSLIPGAALEKFYVDGGFGACYVLAAPPAIVAPPPPPGVHYVYGGRAFARGTYVGVATPFGNVRTKPYTWAPLSTTNPRLSPGERFGCSQTTLAGTNVGGSSTWHGNAAGSQWVHDSVVRPL